MPTLDWSLIVPAGFAVVIFCGGLWMLASGVWASRDK